MPPITFSERGAPYERALLPDWGHRHPDIWDPKPNLMELVFRAPKDGEQHKSRDRLHSLAAALFSILLTVLPIIFFFTPLRIDKTIGEREAIQVVFVTPPDMVRTPIKAAIKVEPSVTTAHERKTPAKPPIRVSPQMNDAQTAAAPLEVVEVEDDDTWTPQPSSGSKFTSHYQRVFSHASVGHVVDHVEPVHIRLKRPGTGEWLIEQAAQTLGFWPPGYDDDPCPGIKKLANYYRGNPDASKLEVVKEAFNLGGFTESSG